MRAAGGGAERRSGSLCFLIRFLGGMGLIVIVIVHGLTSLVGGPLCVWPV